MKVVNVILADLIRRGQVTVEIPGLDMDRMEKMVHNQTQQLLRTVAGVVFDEEAEADDSEKIRCLQELLQDL